MAANLNCSKQSQISASSWAILCWFWASYQSVGWLGWNSQVCLLEAADGEEKQDKSEKSDESVHRMLRSIPIRMIFPSQRSILQWVIHPQKIVVWLRPNLSRCHCLCNLQSIWSFYLSTKTFLVLSASPCRRHNSFELIVICSLPGILVFAVTKNFTDVVQCRPLVPTLRFHLCSVLKNVSAKTWRCTSTHTSIRMMEIRANIFSKLRFFCILRGCELQECVWQGLFFWRSPKCRPREEAAREHGFSDLKGTLTEPNNSSF